MKKQRLFLRNIEAWNFLELFLISAVISILFIRLYLALAGYPKLGGSHFHIAHMLWGGLLMMIAMVIQFSLLGRAAEQLAVITGGIGFGTFIDEVGKFVTHDNDYFFEPSVAIMYVVFVLIFIGAQSLRNRRIYSPREYLLNAIRELEEMVMQDLDEKEKKRALSFLKNSPSGDPVARSLEKLLNQAELAPESKPGPLSRVKFRLRSLYERVAAAHWFPAFLIIFFIGQLIGKLLYAILILFFRDPGWNEMFNIGFLNHISQRAYSLSLANWLELISSLLGGFFVLLGVVLVWKSRLRAYLMFEKSLLISILITQVFVFYREQFAALAGFLFNLILLAFVRFMISSEQRKELEPASG